MKQFLVLERVYLHFAELMIAKIESMTQSWQKPWIFGKGLLPYNLVSGKNYTDVNILTLLMLTEVRGYQTPVYMTFLQAKFLDLQVLKGSKQFSVVFWKPFYLAVASTTGQPRFLSVEDFNHLSEDEAKRYKLQFGLRFYSVLNLNQTNFPERYPQCWQQFLDWLNNPQRPDGAEYLVLERMLETQLGLSDQPGTRRQGIQLAGRRYYHSPSKGPVCQPGDILLNAPSRNGTLDRLRWSP